MRSQGKQATVVRPVCSVSARADALAAFHGVADFCDTCTLPFWKFEKELLARIAVLGACLIRLFLTARYQRLDVRPYLEDGAYRSGDDYAERTLKTVYGEVTYGRQYLQARSGGSGFFPLDVVLGLTRDRLSPWVMQWLARLATRLSFKAAQMVCKSVLHWAPATETIERVVLGMGREAAAFMKQLPAPPDDGDVLVIESDGKCPPTATAAELAKRRGPRKPKHERDCPCGCQRHRGQAKRLARGRKKRRKKGDKSKNGKEVSVVVMYTLRRGADGKLHGPINKKLYATFAGRKAAALWARAEATKRGFGPDTTKTVQIVLDGAKSLMQNLKALFPKAIFTLDVQHVVERLWKAGRHFHPEGSDELQDWVDDLKALVYVGKIKTLIKHLQEWLAETPHHGPGTKSRRQALMSLLGYLKPRIRMMRYGQWLKQDLVIATGQVEGAVRHLVGERFDCAGMRWVQGKAEALLHLRCIELNRDWQEFDRWFQERTRTRLQKSRRHKILTDQPLTLAEAA
ncbi:MAG TPA: UPF0236 family protein [Gemmataceae bacterium]|nr:UPF0236 family protein [Gemmataceae bacterium]